MFDRATLEQLESGYQSSKKKTQEKPEVNGLTRFLAEAAPIVGGTLGAIGGSFVAPVAGTAVGGAAGAGLGSAIRQKLLGEDLDAGEIVTDAAFGAVPGVGKLAKGIAGGTRALRAGDTANDASKLSVFTQGAKDAVGVAKPSTVVPSKLNQGARNSDMKQSGLAVGQSVRGETLTPERADELYSFAREGSVKYGTQVKAGAPIDQARQAQDVYKGVTGSLDETLAKIDRPLVKNEVDSLVGGISERIKANSAITGTSKTADKLTEKLAKAKTLRELEGLRREADDLAFTMRGAGKTSKAAQAREVRDVIDEFITPLSPEYKAVKGDYMKAKDLLELTSKNSKNAKGAEVFGLGIGEQAIPGLKSKSADFLARHTRGGKVDQGALATAFRPSQLLKTGIAQGTTQSLSNALTESPQTAPVDETTDVSTLTTATPSILPETESDSIWGNEDAIKTAYTRAIMAGDKEAANAILAGYKAFGQSAQKPLSAEASKVIANANSGITSLGQLRSIIKEGGVPGGTLVPGRDLFGGAGASALGTGSYDTAAKNIVDVITRLRTGAALSESEEAFYKSQVPQAFDSPEVIDQKLQLFDDLFRSVANRTGSSGSDTQSSIEGVQ